nr:unnamed protein product [Digitaria exilis]
MKGGGGVIRAAGGGAGAGLMRTRMRLPMVLLSCSLFFLAGFFGSLLFTQDPEEADMPVPRERLLEAAWPEMPYGESGEAAPSLIPYQVMSPFNSAPASVACPVVAGTLFLSMFGTISGTFLSASEDPTGTLAEVEKKIARATMIPRKHGEPFNVLRYEIGQRYASHYDAFDPAQYGPQKSQRVASFLLYLTDVEEGGETMFPYENGENMDIGYDYEKCIGLKVKPRKGDGLLFYSLMVNGTIDPTSLHGSCPVMKGEKWVATKWIRDNTV